MDGVAQLSWLVLVALQEEEVEAVDFVAVENVNQSHGAIHLAADEEPPAEADGEVENLPVEVDGLG